MSKIYIFDRKNNLVSLSESDAREKMMYVLKNGSKIDEFIVCDGIAYEYLEVENELCILKDVTNFYNLKKVNQQLKKDCLTKLYRREGAVELITEYIREAFDNGEPFSIIMGDIDKFKVLNDTKGHDFGDLVLKNIGLTLLYNFRTRNNTVDNDNRYSHNHLKKDIACRYGGEEFLILLKNITLENTIKRIEQVREKVSNLDIDVPVTMSFGIYNYDPKEDKLSKLEDVSKNFDKFVKQADLALYKSKESGRNKTSYFDFLNNTSILVDEERKKFTLIK